MDNLKREAEVAEREGNLERVAQIIYGELPAAEKDFQMFEKKNFGGPAAAKSRKSKNSSSATATGATTDRFLKGISG